MPNTPQDKNNTKMNFKKMSIEEIAKTKSPEDIRKGKIANLILMAIGVGVIFLPIFFPIAQALKTFSKAYQIEGVILGSICFVITARQFFRFHAAEKLQQGSK